MDTEENLSAVSEAVKGLPDPECVELLDYNRSAGGKYKACGMKFSPASDEYATCTADVQMFLSRGVPVSESVQAGGA